MRIRLFIAISLLTLVAATASGQDTSSQQARKAKLEKEIAIIEQQLRENGTKNANALNTLSIVKRKVAVRRKLVAEDERNLEILQDSIRTIHDRAAEIQNRLDTLTLYYDRLVRNAYKNRDARVWYMYILASGNVGQSFRRYGYLRTLSTRMSAQAKEIKRTKAELAARLDSLQTLKIKAVAVQESHQKELKTLKGEEAQSQALIATLNKNKKTYQKQLASKRQQVNALNREIERLIAAEVKKGSSTSKPAKGKTVTQKPIDYKLAEQFESNMGKLPWPCEGTIIEGFGQHNHPVFTSIKMPFNNGVTIGVTKGTQARAVFDGEVKRIIVMPGYNKCVLVQHGNYFTFYCKLGSVQVKNGDKVKIGQAIGTVDTIDGQTQLHFQVWKGTKPQNPENWLRPL